MLVATHTYCPWSVFPAFKISSFLPPATMWRLSLVFTGTPSFNQVSRGGGLPAALHSKTRELPATTCLLWAVSESPSMIGGTWGREKERKVLWAIQSEPEKLFKILLCYEAYWMTLGQPLSQPNLPHRTVALIKWSVSMYVALSSLLGEGEDEKCDWDRDTYPHVFIGGREGCNLKEISFLGIEVLSCFRKALPIISSHTKG